MHYNSPDSKQKTPSSASIPVTSTSKSLVSNIHNPSFLPLGTAVLRKLGKEKWKNRWRIKNLFHCARTKIAFRVAILFKSRPAGFLSSVSCQYAIRFILSLTRKSYCIWLSLHAGQEMRSTHWVCAIVNKKAQPDAMITAHAHSLSALAALQSTVVTSFYMSPTSIVRNIALRCIYVFRVRRTVLAVSI
jgi:hypothetical protein